MGLYTVLKPYLKGENTNLTKNYLKFKKTHQNTDFFQKVKKCFQVKYP